jgi:NAD(P)H-dependent FMN reductase
MLKYFLALLLCFSASLAAETKILAFSGSTRTDSCNKKLLANAAETARQLGAKVTVIDLRDYPIPFYDGDLEKNSGMPENAKKIRNMMLASDGVIIASPEYNGSLSAVLKNVIDWLSRSEQGEGSREAFLGKKFAIMSCSPGSGGGAGGLIHLEAILKRIGGNVVLKKISIPDGYNAFNAAGELQSEASKKELKQEIEELLANH